MTAKTLKSNKLISKTKLKRTIKNVVCRPDPILWPKVSEVERDVIDTLLQKYRIEIPEYKKTHWNEIKLIPKVNRPKQPPLPKVKGLLFGISECRNAMANGTCSALLLEIDINPKLLGESVIEACNTFQVPHICFKGLRDICKNYFGIPTSSLGIVKNNFEDLQNVITVYHKQKYPEKTQTNVVEVIEETHKPSEVLIEAMNVQPYPYLYRKNKNTRIFTPAKEKSNQKRNKFEGQNYINVPIASTKSDRKLYMNMILKKMQNNPDRQKQLNKRKIK
ncbi:unnamed protein product, partial [Leptidea sinapis]